MWKVLKLGRARPSRLLQLSEVALAALGLALSFYATYVALRKRAQADFVALCDFSATSSCSRVIASKYGKGFGLLGPLLGHDNPLVLSNGVYGMVFYGAIILLGQWTSRRARQASVALCACACAASLYLLYVLTVVLADGCVLCIAAITTNALLCAVAVARLSHAKGGAHRGGAHNGGAGPGKHNGGAGPRKQQKVRKSPEQQKKKKTTKKNQ